MARAAASSSATDVGVAVLLDGDAATGPEVESPSWGSLVGVVMFVAAALRRRLLRLREGAGGAAASPVVEVGVTGPLDGGAEPFAGAIGVVVLLIAASFFFLGLVLFFFAFWQFDGVNMNVNVN